MAQDDHYENVQVESYVLKDPSGKHGKVHIRSVSGGKCASNIAVECAKKLSRYYPVGTRFMLQAKLTDREGGGEYLYSSYRSKSDVVK